MKSSSSDVRAMGTQNTVTSAQFDRLFNPRAIAVIGATPDPARPGGQCIHALQEYGYAGGIYPVNPKYDDVGGARCYASLSDIGEPVDIAVIALPAAAAVNMVKTCGEHGIPYVVVLGGGFRESGAEGAGLQAQMLAHARAHGTRIVGPNCLGISNIHQRVFAAFGSLARAPLHKPGPVSMVMQSGGFGNSLSFRCAEAGIGFRIMIASGNEADLTAPELIDALIDDVHTQIILAYLEGVSDGRELMRVGRRALAASKPILIWKAGNSRQGARAAATHTANMTGEYDVWRAAFEQCGMIEVRDTEAAADYIKVLLTRRTPRGRNVAVVSPSGGSAVAFADAADEYGLTLARPSEHTRRMLRELMPAAVSVENPIDLAVSGINEKSRHAFAQTIQAVADDASIDQVCVMFPTLLESTMTPGALVVAEVASRTDKPVLVFSAMPHALVPQALGILADANIPVIPSPTRLARAASVLADYAAQRERASTSSAALQITPQVDMPSTVGALDEAASKRLLAHAGIPVTRDVVLTIHNGVPVAAPTGIQFPVAVKVLSPDIAHKSDIGAVALDVHDHTALDSAAQRVLHNAMRSQPSARIDGVLVCEMITDAVEVIVGVVNDSVFGPVVMLGMGGVLAEALRDVTYRVAPFDQSEARRMIVELRSARIFDGFRGRPACDVDALAAALSTISMFAWQRRERIAELDINPLMVRPAGLGVMAADALIVLN
ncbi:MAG: acetate--CoA ligase family protein [Pseudomonadota bacterium]